MAKKRRVVWTEFALYEFEDACEYWDRRNFSTYYSQKLTLLLYERLGEIEAYPFSGTATSFKGL